MVLITLLWDILYGPYIVLTTRVVLYIFGV